MIRFLVAAAVASAPLVPDALYTPGDTNTAATMEVVCVKGYTSQPGIRHVSQATKDRVFEEYKIDPKSDHFEIDHLISLELGGSNDAHNLWPESYTTKPWNAHVKDALEDRLHALVCSGKVPLDQAQREISTDWISAYKKYVGEQPK